MMTTPISPIIFEGFQSLNSDPSRREQNFIFIDGARGGSGIWRLRVRAELAEGANCGGRGQYVCGDGMTCEDEADGRFCRRAACDDQRDNDNDGRTDYPNDPGCENSEDTDEADPATPRACTNGMDDDNDGLTDFPDDPECQSAADPRGPRLQ